MMSKWVWFRVKLAMLILGSDTVFIEDSIIQGSLKVDTFTILKNVEVKPNDRPFLHRQAMG